MGSEPRLQETRPGTFDSRCLSCGEHVDEMNAVWGATINLTADALFMENTDAIHHFDPPIFEVDVRFNWCRRECFGSWLARAVVTCPAPEQAATLLEPQP